MKADEITKIIQFYMYQNLNSGSSSTSSGMFDTMLMNAIESIINENSSSANSKPGISSQNTDVSERVDTQSSSAKSSTVSNNISDAIKFAAAKYGVEEEFIKAVIKQESAFKANAVSKAGAQGLMQLMPSTSKTLGVENPFNVLDNIEGGTRYLKRLMDAFNGNKELALSAYNGGIGRMNRLGVDTVEEISKMPRETEKYISKVMQNYSNYKKL